jgi:hypothetical protein
VDDEPQQSKAWCRVFFGLLMLIAHRMCQKSKRRCKMEARRRRLICVTMLEAAAR